MSGTTLCPSAAVLIEAIKTRCPQLSEKTDALVKAHGDFIFAVNNLGPQSRDKSLAVTNAEQAFSWALKGITDYVFSKIGEAD